MPHTTATRAFYYSASQTSAPLLMQLYGYLVAIELLIKDYFLATQGDWTGGHDICSMLPQVDSNLGSNALQLFNSLSALICTSRTGAEARVLPKMYPDIRYLRHKQDNPAWANSSSDVELNDAIENARSCLDLLRSLKGIAP